MESRIHVCKGCGRQDFARDLSHYPGCDYPGSVSLSDPSMPQQLSQRALRNRIVDARESAARAARNRRPAELDRLRELRKVYRQRFPDAPRW